MKRYTVRRAGPHGAIRVHSTNDLKTAEAEAHNWASAWIRDRAQVDRLLEAVRGR